MTKNHSQVASFFMKSCLNHQLNKTKKKKGFIPVSQWHNQVPKQQNQGLGVKASLSNFTTHKCLAVPENFCPKKQSVPCSQAGIHLFCLCCKQTKVEIKQPFQQCCLHTATFSNAEISRLLFQFHPMVREDLKCFKQDGTILDVQH